jgi:ribonuclease HI
MKLFAYTDGASRGNPGRGASGYLILDASHKALAHNAFADGVCTNNVAEYKAIIAALRKALNLGCDHIVLSSDSKLAINQLSGNYKVKDKTLKQLNSEAKTLLARFAKRELLNVPRENRHVSEVDRELNELLDAEEKKAALQTKL